MTEPAYTEFPIPRNLFAHRQSLHALANASAAVEQAAVAGTCHELEAFFSANAQICQLYLHVDSKNLLGFRAVAKADDKLATVDFLANLPNFYIMSESDWRTYNPYGIDKKNLQIFRDMPPVAWRQIQSALSGIFNTFADLAPNLARQICANSPNLTGPQAANFASQMGMPDISARIEAAQIQHSSNMPPLALQTKPSL